MSGFQEHFLAKYFGYRSRYVAYVRRVAPERGDLAVLSEVLRLAFVVFACALCALLLWTLTAGAFGRAGAAGYALTFAVLALSATALGLRAGAGVVEAVRDRRPRSAR